MQPFADPNTSSRPCARSTVPTRAALTSRCRTAASRRIDGSSHNPVTDGYICAKVRGFAERVYGTIVCSIRLSAKGRKDSASFQRDDVGRSAGAHRRAYPRGARALGRRVDPALLLRRVERPADAGHERRHAVPPARRVAAGAHRVRGADRRRQRGALRQDGVGHLPGLPRRALIVVWGVQSVGVGHPPGAHIREAQRARRQAGGRRSANDALARQADLHLAGPARHRPAGGAGDSSISLRDRRRRLAFLAAHTRGADGCARRRCRGRSSAPPRKRAIRGPLEAAAELYATTSPAVIRCGWGQERNRNGGKPALAILALPAVGGKFGVRGGGYSMSNSAAWNIGAPGSRADEPRTRAST